MAELTVPQIQEGNITPPSPGTRELFLQSKTIKNTVLKSHGRPPWYGEDGVRHCDAFVIGIAGGSASGKTHVARQIVRALGSIPSVVILSQDSFYKHHTPEEIALAFTSRYDFDHPDAIDTELFASCLADLKACRQTNVPVYSFSEHQRLEETRYLYGAAVIITEGIMALQDPTLRTLYDLKIFVQCDSDLMLARRIKRDVQERGRSLDGILEQYVRYVKPAYDNFVNPTARYADIIVPGANNAVAIELISTHVRRQLDQRSRGFRQRIVSRHPIFFPEKFPENGEGWTKLIVLPETPQLKGIMTILRDRMTSRGDFIFFSDRLATLLVERAMEELPYRPKSVITPVDVVCHGRELAVNHFCAVTILRSGGALERGLRRVIKDVLLGCLLVQSEAKTGEPLLLNTNLPVCIRHRQSAQDTWVFLLDSQIGTAATAFMAIRVLLDHGVPENHIIFVAFLVARDGGISVIRRAFPEVRVVCAAVDDGLREAWLEGGGVEGEGQLEDKSDWRKAWVIEPGMGQIGDRYYL